MGGEGPLDGGTGGGPLAGVGLTGGGMFGLGGPGLGGPGLGGPLTGETGGGPGDGGPAVIAGREGMCGAGCFIVGTETPIFGATAAAGLAADLNSGGGSHDVTPVERFS